MARGNSQKVAPAQNGSGAATALKQLPPETDKSLESWNEGSPLGDRRRWAFSHTGGLLSRRLARIHRGKLALILLQFNQSILFCDVV
jgi:hypothetical protein